MKYKVIKEYNRFYLCESKKGYLECFPPSTTTFV